MPTALPLTRAFPSAFTLPRWTIIAMVATTVYIMVGTGGCAGAPPGKAEGPSASRLNAHLAALGNVSPSDTLQAAWQVEYAAGQLRSAGLQPALSGSFLLYYDGATDGEQDGPGTAYAHVMGYVAGRHPTYADRLVLVTAPLHGASAAGAIEGVHLVSDAATRHIVPEATLGLLLWGPLQTAVAGVQDYLRQPTWATEAIVRVVIVAADTQGVAAQQALWAAQGIPSEVLRAALFVGKPEAGRASAAPLASSYRLAEDVFLRSIAAADHATVADTVLVIDR
jgi:hypothetical protein